MIGGDEDENGADHHDKDVLAAIFSLWRGCMDGCPCFVMISQFWIDSVSRDDDEEKRRKKKTRTVFSRSQVSDNDFARKNKVSSLSYFPGFSTGVNLWPKALPVQVPHQSLELAQSRIIGTLLSNYTHTKLGQAIPKCTTNKLNHTRPDLTNPDQTRLNQKKTDTKEFPPQLWARWPCRLTSPDRDPGGNIWKVYCKTGTQVNVLQVCQKVKQTSAGNLSWTFLFNPEVIVAADQKHCQVKIWFQNRRNKWKRQLAADLEAASLGSGGRYENVLVYLWICVFVYLFV